MKINEIIVDRSKKINESVEDIVELNAIVIDALNKCKLIKQNLLKKMSDKKDNDDKNNIK